MKRTRPAAKSSRLSLAQRFSSWAHNHFSVGRDSLIRIYRTPVQSGLMIAVIAIALTLPTLLYLLSNTVENLSGRIQQTSDLHVFLKQNISFDLGNQLAESWRDLPEVADILVISPDQGRQEFERFSGLSSVLELLETNPFPTVIRVSPQDYIGTDAPAMNKLAARLEESESVEEVQFDFGWLERLNSLLTLVDRLDLVIGLLLATGVILVLINSIRLMIDNRRAEILIVKLVGGTNDFVRRPLLYTGSWLGLLGGLAAILMTDILVFVLSNPVNALITSYAIEESALKLASFEQSLGLLLISTGLGLLAAWIAVARHLDDIEPR